MNKYAHIYIEEFNKHANPLKLIMPAIKGAIKSVGKGTRVLGEMDHGVAAKNFGTGYKDTFKNLWGSMKEPGKRWEGLKSFATQGAKDMNVVAKNLGDTRIAEGAAKAVKGKYNVKANAGKGGTTTAKTKANAAKKTTKAEAEAADQLSSTSRMLRNSSVGANAAGKIMAPLSVIGGGTGVAATLGAFDSPPPPPPSTWETIRKELGLL